MSYTVGSTDLHVEHSPALAGGAHPSPRGVAHALNGSGKPFCLSRDPLHVFPDEGFPVEERDDLTNCPACLAAA